MKLLPSGTVTFLLTDVEGSTPLWEDDAGAMAAAVARLDELVNEGVTSQAGVVVKSRGEGDSHFCVFSRASDACAAANDLIRSTRSEQWPTTRPLAVRMALHTGEAELRGGDYFGQVVNRAARLRAIGHGGQILVSQSTADLAREALPEGAHLLDHGTHRLRDLAEPEHVFELAYVGREAFPRLRSLDLVSHNLPIQLTSFIGRDAEIEEVRRLLLESRLVTLTGPGGSGKTRLALQVSADAFDQFADGVWLVELASVTTPEAALTTVAATFGIRDEEGSMVGPSPDLSHRLMASLQSQRLLLILDNCEHLIAECADVATTILKACRDVTIVATSREALRVAGETVWLVPSLPVEEGVRLFLERAASKRGADLTAADDPSIAQICEQLDGIPLAIELAAGRASVLTAAQIAARLDDRFRLLAGGGRTTMARQQTLSATVDWSYALLSEPERAVLRRLSVFAGGFTLAAAEVVCSGDLVEGADTMDLVAQLVDKSLVIADTARADARYRLLETIRQYANAKLVEAEEAVDTACRHQRCYLDLAAECHLGMHGPEEVAWLDRVDVELDNFRAAVRFGGADGLRIATYLWRSWVGRGPFAEGRMHMERAIADCPADDLELRIAATSCLGHLTMLTAEWADARRLFEETERLAEECSEHAGHWQVAAAIGLGGLRSVAGGGSFDEAERAMRRSVEEARRAEWPFVEALGLMNLALAARVRGDLDGAEILLAEADDVARRCGAPSLHARWYGLAASIKVAGRDWVGADQAIARGVDAAREIGDRQMLCQHLQTQAQVAQRLNQGDRAIGALEEGLAVATATGMELMAARLGTALGYARAAANDLAGAKAVLEAALGRARLSVADLVPTLSHAVGAVQLLAGDLVAARNGLEDALALSRDRGDAATEAAALHDLGTVARRSGEVPAAAREYAAALRLRAARLRPPLVQSLDDASSLALDTGRSDVAARLAGALAAWCNATGFDLPAHLRERSAMASGLARGLDPPAWDDGQMLEVADAVAEALSYLDDLAADR